MLRSCDGRSISGCRYAFPLYYMLPPKHTFPTCMQLGLILLTGMTVVSYVMFVFRACRQRATLKKAHGGQLPGVKEQAAPQEAAEEQSPPVATVVRTPSNEDPAALFPEDSPELTFPMPPKSSSQNPLYATDEAVVVDVPAPKASAVATGGPVAEAHEGSSMHASMSRTRSTQSREAAIEESAEAAAESARQSRRSVRGFLRGLWDSVREDPRSGFRCSSSHPLSDSAHCLCLQI